MSRPKRRFEPEPAHLVARLTRAAQVWCPGARVTDVRRLAGGASSLTYLATVAGGAADLVVVKVAPPGLSATRHRDVLRQARLLAALAGRDGVPVPEVLFTDDGLFAMSHHAGEAYEPNVDDPPASPPGPADLGARVRHAVWVLAHLHARPTQPEWFDAEPVVSLADELDRWDRAFATLPEDFGLDWAARSRRLRATMPPPTPPVVTHGDYRLGNMLCLGPTVTAVIDWEIWARSDGRLDVGWFLLNLDASLQPAAGRGADGLPSTQDVLAAYADAGGIALRDPRWFLAAALYKFAATTGLIGKNARKRGEEHSWGARMITRLPKALRRVDDLLSA